MSNLYGGMPGSSFVLKGRFTSVSSMITAFKRGPQYTDVWYGEYCLIDTANKNDSDNGKIYRRGYDYTNDTGGAEYIGQIVGPSSGTPYVQMNTLDATHIHSTETIGENDSRTYPIGQNEDGTYIITQDTGDIQDFELNRSNAGIVPGKVSDTEFNDSIVYTWVNIRNSGEDGASWFYVGLQIPYTVIDFKTEIASAYDDDGVIKPNPSSISRTDDGSHPYFEEWTIYSSKGIKGDTLRNMRVIIPTDADVIYDFSAFSKNDDGTIRVGSPGYDGQEDDISNGYTILVYDFYVYDDLENPSPYTIYIGDYNQEKGITLGEDGTLTFQQTHAEDVVFDKVIKWINDVSLTTGDGQQGGHFQVLYNNGTPAYETDLTWVKNIDVSEDGTVTYTFAGNGDEDTDSTTGIKVDNNLIKWISNISLNTVNGIFTIGYNNGSPDFTATLDWIKSIVLDNDGTLHFIHTANERDEAKYNAIKWIDTITVSTNGVLTINYNYGEPYSVTLNYVDNITVDETTGDITVHKINSGDTVLSTKLKMITSASINDLGVITFRTNTGDDFNLSDGNGNDFRLRSIDNVVLATSLNADHHIKIKYSDQDSSFDIGDSLNWIQDVVVDNINYHLYVLFTDPSKRPTASDLVNGVDAYGNKWRTGISGSGSVDYSSLYWRDFGAIKDQSGVLIGLNLADDDLLDSEKALSSKEAAIAALNRLYPNGYTNGKIATYAGTLAENKEFFAFDYNNMSWYFLGVLTDGGKVNAVLVQGNTIGPEVADNMATDALAFKVITTKGYDGADLNTTGIPQYWAYNYNAWV